MEGYYEPNSAVGLQYELGLNQLLGVTEGAARTAQCLEAAKANPADVYLFWLAMLASIKQSLDDPKLAIPTAVKEQVRGVANYRWREFFEDGPSQVHLAAFYLNPRTSNLLVTRSELTMHYLPTVYARSDIFTNPNPFFESPAAAALNQQVPEGVKHPKTFLAVARFVAQVAANEINHGINPAFTEWRSRGGNAFQAAIRQQFIAYSHGHFPFNAPVVKDQGIAAWWMAFRGAENASLLGVRYRFAHVKTP